MSSLEQFNVESSPYDSQRQSYNESDEDVNQISNDNIVYQNDDFLLSSFNNSSGTENEMSYCGIKGSSELSVILNIFVSCVSGAVLTFPFYFSTLGILNTLFILLFVTSAIYYSVDLLRSFVVDTKYYSFALMTETILGQKWLRTYSLSSFILYVSALVNYVSLMHSYFKELINTEKYKPYHGILFFLVTFSLELFLCEYTSKTYKIHILSMVSIVSFFIIVCVIIGQSISNIVNNEIEGKFSSEKLFNPLKEESFMKRFLAVMTAVISFVYSYSYHSSFPTLIGNLNSINDTNSKKVHIISFGALFLSYLIITFFGYLFSKKVPYVLFEEDEKLNNNNNIWAILFKIILCVFFFNLIPIRFIVIRDNFTSLIGKTKLTFKKDFLITFIFIFLINVIVFLVDDYGFNKNENYKFVQSLVQVFGGPFSVIISFVLPVINYCSIVGYRKVKSIIGFFIIGIFSIIGLISFINSFAEMIHPESKNKK